MLSSALFTFVMNESHMIKIKPVSDCWKIGKARVITKEYHIQDDRLIFHL